MLLKVNKRPMPMPTFSTVEREAFRATIKAELPAFLHFLLGWEIPTELRSERFGIRHYHHPDLLAAIDSTKREFRFLEFIDLLLWHGAEAKEKLEPQIYSAEELRASFLSSSTLKESVREMLRYDNSAGTLLGYLAKSRGDRVRKIDRKHNRGPQLWR